MLEELKEVYKLEFRLSDFFSSLITEQSIWPLALHFDTLGPLPLGGVAAQHGPPPPPTVPAEAQLWALPADAKQMGRSCLFIP